MTKIDIKKLVTTRDGRKVHDLHRYGDWLWGYIAHQDRPRAWFLSGHMHSARASDDDLINPVEKKTVWLVLWTGSPHGITFESKEEMHDWLESCERPEACLEITYTPGEGLEVGDE